MCSLLTFKHGSMILLRGIFCACYRNGCEVVFYLQIFAFYFKLITTCCLYQDKAMWCAKDLFLTKPHRLMFSPSQLSFSTSRNNHLERTATRFRKSGRVALCNIPKYDKEVDCNERRSLSIDVIVRCEPIKIISQLRVSLSHRHFQTHPEVSL